ncbi:MAG: trigger factor [Pseudomonadota bacterium]|nr:trigger factor [Pseudomonadota bacterium]
MSEGNQLVTIEEISPVKKRLRFEIPWEETRKYLDNTYRIIAKTAKVNGFRLGKTPRYILERYFKDEAEEETITEIFNHYFWEALKEHQLELVARPEVDKQGIAPGESYCFSATVEVEPAFEPEGYLGLEVDREEVEVTEEDVAAKLAELREMYGTMEEVDEETEVAPGLFVVIDFQGHLDGRPLREMKADGYLLEIGSGSFVPGFEDELLGMKKGESKEFTVRFPDAYHHQEAAGKEVFFSARVTNIKEKRLPEVNEEFVRNFDKFDSLEELRADIREKIEAQKKEKADADMRIAMMDRLLEKNPFPVPERMVERQLRSMMIDARWRMEMQGIGPDQAAAMLPEYRDRYKDEANRIVRSFLLIKRIADKENVTVEEEELEARIRDLAIRSGRTSDQYRGELEERDMIDDIRMELKNKKVMELIEAQAVIRPVKKAPAAPEVK